ncbi:MAG: hypothetical protein DCC52_15245 [Chloroflexi bacterium]|nr:MAG: hypothetical protein DCC52_15245 [Chloroflexota bacterium]
MSAELGPDAQAHDAPIELRDDLLQMEYTYLTQSSFRSDELRDRIFQFYLLIVSTAAAVILGLTQMANNGEPRGIPFDVATIRWALATLAVLIGVIGAVMVPIFVRLRRVVLECLQGTVLLKRYVLNAANEKRFNDAFIWDDRTLPRDESYGSASFLLIFVFILLDSVMLSLPFYVWFSDWLRTLAALLWTLIVFVPLVTIQVMLYRYRLARELASAMERNRFTVKWIRLGIETVPDAQPEIRKPLLQAFGAGALALALVGAVNLLLEWGALRF